MPVATGGLRGRLEAVNLGQLLGSAVLEAFAKPVEDRIALGLLEGADGRQAGAGRAPSPVQEVAAESGQDCGGVLGGDRGVLPQQRVDVVPAVQADVDKQLQGV